MSCSKSLVTTSHPRCVLPERQRLGPGRLQLGEDRGADRMFERLLERFRSSRLGSEGIGSLARLPGLPVSGLSLWRRHTPGSWRPAGLAGTRPWGRHPALDGRTARQGQQSGG